MVAVGTRIARYVDRLGLTPPHIRPESAVEDDVREADIGDRSLVAVLYADASVAVAYDAIVHCDTADRVHILAAYLDGTRPAGHDAVAHDDVPARSVFFPFAAVLQADAVVARGDVAVGNAHMPRVVDVDAVAVAYLQVVEQRDAIYQGSVAADEVDGPVGSVADGDIADDEVLHADKRQHMGTWVEGGVNEGLQLVAVVELASHKGHAVAVDGTQSGDAQVLHVAAPQPHHALAAVLLEGAEAIFPLVGMGHKAAVHIEVEVDVRLQLYGTRHKGMTRRQEHLSPTLPRAFVDGTLQGHGIVGKTVARGSVVHHVVDVCLCCSCQHPHQCRCHHQPSALLYHVVNYCLLLRM